MFDGTVLHCTYHECTGGANVAAYRLHEALRGIGIDSQMLVLRRQSQSPYVHDVFSLPMRKMHALALRVEKQVCRWLHRTGNDMLHNYAQLGCRLPGKARRLAPSIIHLHWVGNGLLRISDLPRFDCPVVWTLHDMWAFSGAAHYDSIAYPGRYRQGYEKTNIPPDVQGIDMDRYIWGQKLNYWETRPEALVSPSHWLAGCARGSRLFHGRQVDVIPNAIPEDFFTPYPAGAARQHFGIPYDWPVVLAGAASATEAKGFRLLAEAWAKLEQQYQAEAPCLIVVGPDHVWETLKGAGKRIRFLGKLDSNAMRLAYQAADVVAVPSRLDNLPQVATEAQAFGKPVVAFDVCGLPEIIAHQETGLLAPPYDTTLFSQHLARLLGQPALREAMGAHARQRAMQKYHPHLIASAYASLYATLVQAST